MRLPDGEGGGRTWRPADVPAEYAGLARQLRRDLIAADLKLKPAVAKITAPIKARIARYPGRPLRHDLLLDVERRWRRELPNPEYRMGIASDDAGEVFTVQELRLSASEFRAASWPRDSWQLGCGISRITLIARRGHIEVKVEPLIILSHHCLARWYERSGRRDLESMKCDLLPLLCVSDGDQIPAGDGAWIAPIEYAHHTDGRTMRMRGVKSFVPNRDRARAA